MGRASVLAGDGEEGKGGRLSTVVVNRGEEKLIAEERGSGRDTVLT